MQHECKLSNEISDRHWTLNPLGDFPEGSSPSVRTNKIKYFLHSAKMVLNDCDLGSAKGPQKRARPCPATAQSYSAILDQVEKPPPLLKAAILSGISLCYAVAHSGSSTGKLFIPLGNATGMLTAGAA
jgi:hypothetical protein